MQTFVCLDTNIYVRFVTQGKPGCEQPHWDYLVSQVESKSVALIVPEVVKLETERQWLLVPKDVKAELVKARKEIESSLRKQITWTENQEFSSKVLERFDELQTTKEMEMDRRIGQVRALFSLPVVEHVELTTEIWLRARKRLMVGGLADPEKKSNGDADSCIVESLIDFFSSWYGEPPQLHFCTENTNDYGLPLERGNFAIHPKIKEGLPTAELSLDLSSLVKVIEENKPIELPTEKAIREAVEKEEERQIVERAKSIKRQREALNRRIRLRREQMKRNYVLPDEEIDRLAKSEFQSEIDGLKRLEEAIADAEFNAWFDNLISNPQDSSDAGEINW